MDEAIIQEISREFNNQLNINETENAANPEENLSNSEINCTPLYSVLKG